MSAINDDVIAYDYKNQEIYADELVLEVEGVNGYVFPGDLNEALEQISETQLKQGVLIRTVTL